jgi:hypothetical protein
MMGVTCRAGFVPSTCAALLGISTASAAEHLAVIRRDEEAPMNLGTSPTLEGL